MERAVPDVVADAEWSQHGKVWLLKILCPFCGKQHTHGGGSEPLPGLYGHRWMHCSGKAYDSDNPGYNLIPSTNPPRREP